MKSLKKLYHTFLLVWLVGLSYNTGIGQANNTYYIQKIDHADLKAYYDDVLEEEAEKLADLINTGDPNNPFKVLSYNIIPSLAYAEEVDFENSLDYVESELENENGAYLAIIKMIVLSDTGGQPKPNIKFDIRFVLPDISPYNASTAIIKDGMKGRLERLISSDFSDSRNSIGAEISILNEFGTLANGGIDEKLALEEAGFTEVSFQGFDIRYSEGPAFREKNMGSRTSCSVDEYAILEIAEEGTNNYSNILDYMEDTLTVNGVTLNIFMECTSSSFNGSSKEELLNKLSDCGNNAGFQYYFIEEHLGKTWQYKLYWRVAFKFSDNERDEIVAAELENSFLSSGFTLPAFGSKKNNSSRSSSNTEWAKWGKNKVDDMVDPISTSQCWDAVGYGIIDGFLGSVAAITSLMNSLIVEVSKDTNYLRSVIKSYAKEYALTGENFYTNKAGKDNVDYGWINDIIVEITLFLVDSSKRALFINSIVDQMKKYFGTIVSGTAIGYYEIGKLAFEVIMEVMGCVVTGGAFVAKSGANFLRKLVNLFKGKKSQQMIQDIFSKFKLGKNTKKGNICGIKIPGCFVKDTPVLMANTSRSNIRNFNFGNTAKAMAVAASMPIVAVPIQEVQLLDYAVAHETVNATYGMTASADVADPDRSIGNDIYLGLMDKDPYTSDQQRERDEYEINDTDWNEVVFEEVYGGSIARLALHNDWIEKQSYKENVVLNLNLPEMGITGLFEITSIKHILPQKKPVDEDETDGYSYKPVTGLFIHEASDVWRIKFDNGEKLGVTHKHPIYSTTKGDWELAGELEIGEEVLTKDGGAKVVLKEQDQAQQVYNLEVKDLHNFLVNASGIVVHNTGCLDAWLDLFKWNKRNVGGKNWVDYAPGSGMPLTKEINQLESLGSKLNKRFMGLGDSPRTNRPFPGIDGFDETGKAISLKHTDAADNAGGLMSAMVRDADELNKGLVHAHEDLAGMFNKIDGMVTAKASNKHWLKQRWQAKLNDSNLNTDIVDKLYVEAKEGMMMWQRTDSAPILGEWIDL